jgi:hypothetical protein
MHSNSISVCQRIAHLPQSSRRLASGFAAAALLLAACSTVEEYGHVRVALETVGDDGETYRLTPGTRLFVTSGSFFYGATLDGNETTLSFELPPGDYEGELFHHDGYSTRWPLDRIFADGTTEVVTAELITPIPALFSITEGETTQLVFEFRLPTGDTVTFDRGQLDVSISVERESATSFDAQLDGTLGVETVQLGDAPPEVLEALPEEGTAGLSVFIDATLTGDWLEVGGEEGSDLNLCAPLEIRFMAGHGHDGFGDLIAEAGFGESPGFLFGSASICLVDTGDTNLIRIRTSRVGEPTTATFAGSTDELLVMNIFMGELPAKAYDFESATLDLDVLLGQVSMPLFGTSFVFDQDFGTLWYGATYDGEMTFSFVGNL